MPALEHMTWVRNQKRWTKQYRKHIYSVSCKQLGTETTKEASRAAANIWWESRQTEIDQDNAQHAIEPVWLKQRSINYSQEGIPSESISIQVGRDIDNMTMAGNQIVRILNTALAKPLLNQVEIPTDRTVSGVIDAFLKHKLGQAETGDRSVGRYGTLKTHLERFRDWYGSTLPIEGFTEKEVGSYYSHLLSEIRDDKISRAYARDLFASLKQFINWCWERNLLVLPKNIKSKEFGFRTGNSTIKLFSLEEIKKLLNDATDRTQLYILLMLNCGMTQQDISDLHPDEVDWSLGRIKRKRSKTSNHESVPEVEYLLWKKSFQLLRQERSEDEHNVLLNSNGKPLKYNGVDGVKFQKIDNIKTAWNRLSKATDIAKPPKLLRKTAASKLAEHENFGRYATLFLGHAPKTVADRHYVVPSQEQFDNAIAWLGKQFDQ